MLKETMVLAIRQLEEAATEAARTAHRAAYQPTGGLKARDRARAEAHKAWERVCAQAPEAVQSRIGCYFLDVQLAAIEKIERQECSAEDLDCADWDSEESTL
jgi:hypothetical protein